MLVFILCLLLIPSSIILVGRIATGIGAVIGIAAIAICGGPVLWKGIIALRNARRKPIYAKQLQELSPAARFFVDMQPMINKKIDGVEAKMKIRSEIETQV